MTILNKFYCLGIAAALFAGFTAAPAAGASSEAFKSDRNLAKKYEKYHKAVAMIGKGDYAGAVPVLNQALGELPNDADVLNQLGFAKRHLGALDESMTYYQQALTANPNHKGVREYLGELYLMLGKLDDAKVQMTELERICALGCEEKRELREKIDAYTAGGGKVAP